MSTGPRPESVTRSTGEAPLPRDAAGTEDIIQREPRDETAGDGEAGLKPG
jgi:hypothetical protein